MTVEILQGDCAAVLDMLPDGYAHCCVTSPPYYGLRDYGVEGQIGLEETPEEYVVRLVEVFREVRRVLRDDGTLWLNLGDSYAGTGGRGPQSGTQFADRQRGKEAINRAARYVGGDLKPKDLMGIPWAVAFALRADGWYLRQDIIWHKPNPMPESVKDRCTKAHEYIFLFAKNENYYFDAKGIEEPAVDTKGPGNTKAVRTDNTEKMRTRGNLHNIGVRTSRNKRSVWPVTLKPFKGAHFATFPPDLIEPCIKAGCPTGGVVLDPFGGAGTTGLVAQRLGRHAALIELNPEYAAMARDRISAEDIFA